MENFLHSYRMTNINVRNIAWDYRGEQGLKRVKATQGDRKEKCMKTLIWGTKESFSNNY